jgi:hypothetical protein
MVEHKCQGVGGEKLREGGHSEDPDVDGRIILRCMFKKLERIVGTEWSWRVLVSTVKNLRVP